MAVNAVLVEWGQSGQDYRVCLNFVRPNTHSKLMQYPLPEVPQIVDEQAAHNCWSVMDLKVGFNNIPIKPECYH